MAASQCLSRPPTKIGLFETEVVKRTLFSGVTIGGEELELMRARLLPCNFGGAKKMMFHKLASDMTQ